MGILNLGNVGYTLEQYGLRSERALLYIFASGTDNLCPLFEDYDLRTMIANPMQANGEGKFEICYLPEGSYRVVIKSNQGETLIDQSGVSIMPNAGLGIRQGFCRVIDLLNDTFFSYAEETGLIEITTGEILRVSHGNHHYKVLPEDATEHHLLTQGVSVVI